MKPTDHGWSITINLSLHFYFYVILFLLVACVGSVLILMHSRIGLALKAISKDETVAASSGIDCTKYKMLAFIFSTVWPAIFGAVYAPFMVYISPEAVFDHERTLTMFLFFVFGGVGNSEKSRVG